MRLGLVLLACALAVLAAPAAEAAAPPRMQLISRSLGGGFPNGPSHNGVISQDRQRASLVAFDSDASNIVRGDTNGLTDVFLLSRKKPYGLKGPPWRRGKTVLASRGLGD